MPPGKPTVVDGAGNRVEGATRPYEEGQQLELTCLVHGGKEDRARRSGDCMHKRWTAVGAAAKAVGMLVAAGGRRHPARQAVRDLAWRGLAVGQAVGLAVGLASHHRIHAAPWPGRTGLGARPVRFLPPDLGGARQARGRDWRREKLAAG